MFLINSDKNMICDIEIEIFFAYNSYLPTKFFEKVYKAEK